MAMKSGNKDAIVKEVDNQIKVHNEVQERRLHRRAEAPSARTRPRRSRPRRRWRGTSRPSAPAVNAAPATRRPWSSRRCSTSGRRYLHLGGVRHVPVPAHRQGGLADIYKIKYAMADLLYFQKDWAKCGPAFDSVVRRTRRGRGGRGRVRRRCSATRTSTKRLTRVARIARAAATCRARARRLRRTRRRRRQPRPRSSSRRR
jgi:hypothetical protein